MHCNCSLSRVKRTGKTPSAARLPVPQDFHCRIFSDCVILQMLDEAERSFHDALCVVRSLVKTKALLPGGGAPEMEVSVKLHQW